MRSLGRAPTRCSPALLRANVADLSPSKLARLLWEVLPCNLAWSLAQAMPAAQYTFKPHPESMTFGELMLHVAITNYGFCAGLKDAGDPVAAMLVPATTDKVAVVKFLSGSFDYGSGIIPQLSEEQLAAVHGSPDGRLPGREVLLVMFIHVAHHRGQAEVYLRDQGIKPPSYRI